MNNYKVIKVKSVLSVHAAIVLKFSLPCSREKYVQSFGLHLCKHLLILKKCSVSRIIMSALASLSVIGWYSPVSNSHWMQEKSALMYTSYRWLTVCHSEPQAGSGTNSRVMGGFLYAATITLKRVTVMTFRIIKYFHGSKSKLQTWFSQQKGS